MKFRKFLVRSYKDFGLLVLRLGAGSIMLLSHGIPKLSNFNGSFHAFPDPLGMNSEVSYLLTVFAEVFCSFAIIIGLFTRFAAIPLIITMLVAILIVHDADPWGKKELATMFLTMYVTLFLSGGGKYSVDSKIL